MNHGESREFQIAMALARKSLMSGFSEASDEDAKLMTLIVDDVESRLASSNFEPAPAKIWFLRFQVLLQGFFWRAEIPGAWDDMCKANTELNVAEEIEGISQAAISCDLAEGTKRI